MVVQPLIAVALALPTGMLFGVGYGTGVRIGYEQIYPLLFPKKAEGSKPPNATEVRENLLGLNKIYDTIGGKEASNMGIAQGLNNARSEIENNPDFRYFEELESKQSGRTPSNSAKANQLEETEQLRQQALTSFDNLSDVFNRIDLTSDVQELTQYLNTLRSGQSFTRFNEAEKLNIEQKLISRLYSLTKDDREKAKTDKGRSLAQHKIDSYLKQLNAKKAQFAKARKILNNKGKNTSDQSYKKIQQGGTGFLHNNKGETRQQRMRRIYRSSSAYSEKEDLRLQIIQTKQLLTRQKQPSIIKLIKRKIDLLEKRYATM